MCQSPFQDTHWLIDAFLKISLTRPFNQPIDRSISQLLVPSPNLSAILACNVKGVINQPIHPDNQTHTSINRRYVVDGSLMHTISIWTNQSINLPTINQPINLLATISRQIRVLKQVHPWHLVDSVILLWKHENHRVAEYFDILGGSIMPSINHSSTNQSSTNHTNK